MVVMVHLMKKSLTILLASKNQKRKGLTFTGQRKLLALQKAQNSNGKLKRRYILIQSGNTKQMQFGLPFITPPLYYCFVYPTQLFLSKPQPQNCKASSQTPNPITKHQITGDKDQIIITREDLLEEGYEQSKRPWTEEEDQLLLKLCANPNAFFDEVAVHLPGRNSKMCYSRYRRLMNQSKKYWTKVENQRLKALVEEHGQNSWKELVQFFPSRTFKQLKDHYENFLQPTLDGKEWTLEEDLTLISLINQHGQKWKHIQSLMPYRSCSQLKNRFFGRLKRLNDKKLASYHQQAQLIDV